MTTYYGQAAKEYLEFSHAKHRNYPWIFCAWHARNQDIPLLLGPHTHNLEGFH
jgi:hypothetical protein